MIINWNFNSSPLEDIIKELEGVEQEDWLTQFYLFLKEYSSKDEFIVQTSGTTGEKKQFRTDKNQMQTSAKATLNFFNLKPGASVFLNLSCEFIAGKMMLVRAIEGRLNCFLSKPSSDPSYAIDQDYDFAPFVPMQIKNLLKTGKVKKINQLLIGGGKVEETLINDLQKAKVNAYESFGMTETLTHFALKKLSPIKNKYFEVLEGFKISQSDSGNLIINENPITQITVYTKDIIVLKNANNFIWKGRSDNLINSGGVKLMPEEIEDKISKHISFPFVLIGLQDDILGEKIVLVVESNHKIDLNLINTELNKFEKIKECKFLTKFPKTVSGKIKRKAIIRQLSA